VSARSFSPKRIHLNRWEMGARFETFVGLEERVSSRQSLIAGAHLACRFVDAVGRAETRSGGSRDEG
jgi:hypothetical protein